MSLHECLLSEYGKASFIPSPVNRMMTSFARDFRPEKDINLGVGYVNEATIPKGQILKAMEKVLANPHKHPIALNYGGSKGSPNLIEAIKRFLLSNQRSGLTPELLHQKEIIIGPNGATSLLEALAPGRGCRGWGLHRPSSGRETQGPRLLGLWRGHGGRDRRQEGEDKPGKGPCGSPVSKLQQ